MEELMFLLPPVEPLTSSTARDQWVHQSSSTVGQFDIDITMGENKQPDDAAEEQSLLAWYSKKTTWHGLQYILSPNLGTIRRIIWIIIVLTCVTIFAWTIANRVMFYTSYPIKSESVTVNTAEMPFPSVTLCSQSPLKLTALDSNGKYAAIKTAYDNADNWELAVSVAGANITNLVTTAGPSVNKLFISCEYNSQACGTSSFKTRLIRDLGQCFTFSTTAYTTYSGLKGGLQLLLNSESYDATLDLGGQHGIKVFVHDKEEPPTGMDEDGIDVQPGSAMKGQVSLTKSDRLAPPFSDCGETEPNCAFRCMVEHLISQCRCVPYYAQGKGRSVCSTAAEFNCSNAIENSNSAMCDCPMPCKEKEYSVQTTFSQMSENNAKKEVPDAKRTAMETAFTQAKIAVTNTGVPALPASLTYRDNIIRIQLFYKSLRYQHQKQLAGYTMDDLMRDIGFNLLIWFGMSVISLVELIDLVVVAILKLCKKD